MTSYDSDLHWRGKILHRIGSLAFACFLISSANVTAYAQPLPDAKVAEMIAASKRLTASDKNGCLKPEDASIIVVCGESEDSRRQRVFKDGEIDPDRIIRGEAVSTERAAACVPGTGCKPPFTGGFGMAFGYVPPPAIPLEEVLRGLPEPEMVVSEE